MAFNLRLTTLKLRQKLNFRLVKLLLVVIYLGATFSFLIHHVTGTKGNGAEELIVEVDSNKIPFIHTKTKNAIAHFRRRMRQSQ